MADLHLYPGQRFEGVGQAAGLKLTVLACEPENGLRYGVARVRIDSPSDAAVRAAEAHLQYVRTVLPAHAEFHERALERLRSVREEEREFAWFAQWIKDGHLREVREEVASV